ncbi:aldehyde dehydrogenase family protein [Aspergillus puulaauensis]|uniref:Aldehyde dehydrogenase domain-containing protein n=1 Tax=Aspergillus puulaauensis TaxID=1220207 RepID=A0A7R8AF81_9EURO|nr:uncharacterized protein APUU_10027S [Aspergillus puulaauensis]BCS17199.1 hypothetical protein APUU_10027S [Aspergillus puulaauensis]
MEGIEVLAGGERQGSLGNFLKSTVLLNPDLASKVYTEEIFGPVLCVRTFKTEEEAIALANDTQFGLGATIYTADIARALRVSQEVEAGTLGINTGFVPNKLSPFRGWKQSGIGREGGPDGLKSYLQSKTIHINMALNR